MADNGNDAIAQSMQLVAGRVAQEYNQRKNRKGAFWEDRYHATAVMQEKYMLQCLIYIDLNMVRAGVVSHPKEYKYTGFNEIVGQQERYQLIDRTALKNYCGYIDLNAFIEEYKRKITTFTNNRDEKWTSSVAVGSEEYVKEIKRILGPRARFKEVVSDSDYAGLKESQQ